MGGGLRGEVSGQIGIGHGFPDLAIDVGNLIFLGTRERFSKLYRGIRDKMPISRELQ